MTRQGSEFRQQEFLAAEVTGLELEGDWKIVHTNRGDFKTLGVVYAGRGSSETRRVYRRIRIPGPRCRLLRDLRR